MQAIFYTLAFMNSLFMTMIGTQVGYNVVEKPEDFTDLDDRPHVFAGMFLLFAFYPLQGFFNGLIYIRPDWVRWKRAHPDDSWLWALWYALHHQPTEQPTREQSSGSSVVSGNSTSPAASPVASNDLQVNKVSSKVRPDGTEAT